MPSVQCQTRTHTHNRVHQHHRKTATSRLTSLTLDGLINPATVCVTPPRTRVTQWTPPWRMTSADSVLMRAIVSACKQSLQSEGRLLHLLRLQSLYRVIVKRVVLIQSELRHVETWLARHAWYRGRRHHKRHGRIFHPECRRLITHAQPWLTSSISSVNAMPLSAVCLDEDSSLLTRGKVEVTSSRRKRLLKSCPLFLGGALRRSLREEIRILKGYERFRQ